MEKITVSLIKADVGGFPGHLTQHPELMERAKKQMEQAKKDSLLVDYHVLNAGDDLQLLMSHRKGVDFDYEEIYGISWLAFETVETATEVAKEFKLPGAKGNLLVDAFSGNIGGMSCLAEMEFTKSCPEPLVAFTMDKTVPGAFNYPIYKIFAAPI